KYKKKTYLFSHCCAIIKIGGNMTGSSKIFKNLDEQIQILLDKGLVINDVDKTKIILLRENYFFISGYRQIFMKDKKLNQFIEGTTFEELYAMFLFDRKIRNIFFKFILVIENNIKSILSYQLSKKYGFKDKDYLNPKNFTIDSMKTRQVRDIINKMKRQIRVNGRQHTATYHYMANYGYIPMWILVKVLSFGIISELYGILKNEDQIKIAEMYNLDIETLSIYLNILSNYRNICAHEEVLFEHRTQRAIPDTKFHRYLQIEKIEDEYKYGKSDMYAVVIIMRQLLSDVEFRDVVNEISYEVDVLDGKIDTVTIKSILNTCGFPDNWKSILDNI
ncbi:MAG: Abi family protein, partial [Bacilli bacterium]